NCEKEKENIFVKKASVILLIVIANVVDILVLKNRLNIGILVIAFYIYDSGMAILNNVKRLEVPLPSVLVKILKLLSGE
ncbi:MAG: phage holin family protein, partial [Lachnospiraceae bacterium]|nr:phage holin family protein [Lachnospiraceae bacterium]